MVYHFFKLGKLITGLTILAIILASAGFCLAEENEPAAAALYLSPSAGSFLTGSVFTVSIFLNSAEKEINTVLAEIEFPPDILQVTSPTTGSSFIGQWITPPRYSNEQGLISLQGGVPGGIKTSAGLVSAITFRAVSAGQAKINFKETSKVLLNDGFGTDILTNKRGGAYEILLPLPEGPAVASPTHANPNLWYSDASPSFAWEKSAWTTAFSWALDQNPSTRPDTEPEGAETIASFEWLSDGLWYFHLREQKAGVWGNVSHAAVKIDTSPPETFQLKIEAPPKGSQNNPLLYFQTKDIFSGVDYYQVGLLDLRKGEKSGAFFSEQTSPYQITLTGAELSNYRFIVKAVDKAGNIRQAETSFQNKEKYFYSWLFWFLLLAVLGLFSGGALLYFRKKKANFLPQSTKEKLEEKLTGRNFPEPKKPNKELDNEPFYPKKEV